MLRRYASHFILLPGYGYLRQYAVEVKEGYVSSIFPLTEEIENVEWFPGVIVLLQEKKDTFEKHDVFQRTNEILSKIPDAFCNEQFPTNLQPYLFYPFDFTTMQPADGTRHKQLL